MYFSGNEINALQLFLAIKYQPVLLAEIIHETATETSFKKKCSLSLGVFVCGAFCVHYFPIQGVSVRNSTAFARESQL